jgi:pentatricopeptide repeat protein
MQSLGVFTTVQQKIIYLESIFFNGNEKEALQKWEEVYRKPPSGRRRDLDPEFFESGVKMHALADNSHRAHEVAESLYSYHPSWGPAAKLSVFRALARSETSDDHQLMAWKWYVQIKLALGETANLANFDTCFIGFLEGGHLSHAKRVFEDMIEAGLLANEYTHDQIHEVLRRLHLLYRLGHNISSITGIALHAISILPKPYHSQVFGDWMKLAVVKKAPEATAQILDMMFNRGTIPETFHFNLLLKALFRTKAKKHELKAENIGWHMIEETSEPFPKNLRFLHAGDAIASKQGLDMVKMADLSQSRKMPPANVNTFAILMQYHANHSQWEHVDYLARRMRELNILPNEDVMNVLMDSQCRQGNYNKVWDIYTSMTNVPESTPGVFPNGATFRCLWKTLRMALGDHSARENNTLPSPRQLLAENLQWWNLVRSRVDAGRFRIGLAAQDHGALNSLIMHCFSYVKDLPGSLVAMHALHKEFGLPPSNKAMSILQNHIAWIDMHRESGSVRAQYSRSGVPQRKIEQIGQIYSILQDARFKRMNITGDQWAYMSKEEMADFSLNILSEFIRVILKRQHSPNDVEGMIDDAKRDIGLPKLTTGDMDAFSVV